MSIKIQSGEARRAHLDTAPIMESEPGCASGESGNHYPWNTMSTEPRGPRPLREIEMEVEAEGREWTRQRLQQRLQEEADRHGEVFPPSAAAGRSIGARTRCRCAPPRGWLS